MPVYRGGVEVFLDPLADRDDRCSTVVTTNLAFSEWVQVFGDEKLTNTLLDRLGHHAHMLTPKDESARTRLWTTARTEVQPTQTRPLPIPSGSLPQR